MKVNRKIDVLGRVVIPAEFRNVLGIVDGDEVSISLENGVIMIAPVKATCKQCGSHEDVLDGRICQKCVDEIVSSYSQK